MHDQPSTTLAANRLEKAHYLPDDHNKGKALATIDHGLTSGS
ncbi:hypothetical protein ACIOFV_52935 [Streptomyces mirabilis]